jgi:hypothetical protein
MLFEGGAILIHNIIWGRSGGGVPYGAAVDLTQTNSDCSSRLKNSQPSGKGVKALLKILPADCETPDTHTLIRSKTIHDLPQISEKSSHTKIGADVADLCGIVFASAASVAKRNLRGLR